MQRTPSEVRMICALFDRVYLEQEQLLGSQTHTGRPCQAWPGHRQKWRLPCQAPPLVSSFCRQTTTCFHIQATPVPLCSFFSLLLPSPIPTLLSSLYTQTESLNPIRVVQSTLCPFPAALLSPIQAVAAAVSPSHTLTLMPSTAASPLGIHTSCAVS